MLHQMIVTKCVTLSKALSQLFHPVTQQQQQDMFGARKMVLKDTRILCLPGVSASTEIEKEQYVLLL